MDRLIYDRIRELETDHWWFVGRRTILRRLLGRIGAPTGAKILEVGCGAGGNVPLLREFGAVAALEPDDESRAYASERLNLAIDTGLLPDGLPYAPESFDLVCAFDVVEHVDDDAASVKALAGLIKPGGAMLTTVPAYQWMWSHHDVLHHHKRRYLLPQYRALFDQAGLTVETATYFNTLLFPLAAAQRTVKKLVGDNSADDTMPPGWLNKALAKVFSLEAPLAAGGGLPFGLSIAVIARKAG
ncbi:class I SAM-dependent methyltransferase [Caulobacter sp.]|uniref:class I SAM-dependent methyltransferase n=1 Tax=Caulobacter sp. TaxID=78 RepID=UPI001B1FD87F|nr:class I SAM-dependent methyltransferase [Caulobacter sp.]MBO9545772.1 class I SAM-dependent methyltransferase [Caulobacter sp.]